MTEQEQNQMAQLHQRLHQTERSLGEKVVQLEVAVQENQQLYRRVRELQAEIEGLKREDAE